MTDIKGGKRSDKNASIILKIKKGDEIIVFDTETSGLDPKTDEILSISGIVGIWNGSEIDESHRFNQFIRNKYPISKEAADVNGLTNDILAEYPYEEDVIDDLFKIFGNNPRYICGHNVSFDIKFLASMYERNEKGVFEPLNVIDTCACAKDIWKKSDIDNMLESSGLPKKEEFRLQTLVPLLGLNSGLEFHLSMDDVIGTKRLFELEYQKYKIFWNLDSVKAETPVKILYITEKRYSGLTCPQPVRGDYLSVGTDAGLYRFDKLNRTWKTVNEIRSVPLESIIDAVCEYLNIERYDDLQYWHPSAEETQKDAADITFPGKKSEKVYIVPIGKFKGLTIEQIAKQENGKNYIEWAANNMSGPCGDQFRAFYDNYKSS